MVERLTVVVDAVLGILRNQLVTSSILVVRTSLPFFRLFCKRFALLSSYLISSHLLPVSLLIFMLLPTPQLPDPIPTRASQSAVSPDLPIHNLTELRQSSRSSGTRDGLTASDIHHVEWERQKRGRTRQGRRLGWDGCRGRAVWFVCMLYAVCCMLYAVCAVGVMWR